MPSSNETLQNDNTKLKAKNTKLIAENTILKAKIKVITEEKNKWFNLYSRKQHSDLGDSENYNSSGNAFSGGRKQSKKTTRKAKSHNKSNKKH